MCLRGVKNMQCATSHLLHAATVQIIPFGSLNILFCLVLDVVAVYIAAGVYDIRPSCKDDVDDRENEI